MRLIINTTLLLGLLMFSSFSGKVSEPISMIGKVVNDFTLKNIDTRNVSLSSYKNAKGFIIVFTCNHCPFAKLYPKRLNDLNTKYKPLGVPLLAINPMDATIYEEEVFEMMQKKANTAKFNFPYLQDDLQIVGKNFHAEHTPQAFVIWKVNDNWVVKYSGAIDDNGQHPELATPFIAKAVDNLLMQQPVLLPETQSFGCKIIYKN
jgi:peroxiredoxin